jgi:hypothetical protein
LTSTDAASMPMNDEPITSTRGLGARSTAVVGPASPPLSATRTLSLSLSLSLSPHVCLDGEAALRRTGIEALSVCHRPHQKDVLHRR